MKQQQAPTRHRPGIKQNHARIDQNSSVSMCYEPCLRLSCQFEFLETYARSTIMVVHVRGLMKIVINEHKVLWILHTLYHLDSCNVSKNKFLAYFMNRTRTRTRTLGKADPGSLEKADPTWKFTLWVKNPFLTNLRVLISSMTIVF